MRITITLDDSLCQQAVELAEPEMDQTELYSEATRSFIRVQTGKRLTALGGQAPDLPDVLRRPGTPGPA